MAFLLNGPVTAVFVFCGVILNLTTVFILLNPSRRTLSSGAKLKREQLSLRKSGSWRVPSSARPLIYTYLLWIAFSDTSLLLNAFLMYCVPTFMTSLGFYARLFPISYMLSNASLTASVWLMCALMVERYRALCRPLSTQAQQVSVARVHRTLTAVVLLALLFSLPRLFELSLFEHEGEVYVQQTFLVENRLYMIGYRIIGGLLFYSLLPYIGLFTLSTRISFAMHAASKERQRLACASRKKSRRESSDSELILLAVMGKFLLSRLMPTALDVAEHIVSAKEFLNSSTATICVDISNLLVVISSATNFFIYFAFSRSFRRVVCPRFVSVCCAKKTLHKKRQRRNLSIRRTLSNSSPPSHPSTVMKNSAYISTPLLSTDLPTPRIEVLI